MEVNNGGTLRVCAFLIESNRWSQGPEFEPRIASPFVFFHLLWEPCAHTIENEAEVYFLFAPFGMTVSFVFLFVLRKSGTKTPSVFKWFVMCDSVPDSLVCPSWPLAAFLGLCVSSHIRRLSTVLDVCYFSVCWPRTKRVFAWPFFPCICSCVQVHFGIYLVIRLVFLLHTCRCNK